MLFGFYYIKPSLDSTSCNDGAWINIGKPIVLPPDKLPPDKPPEKKPEPTPQRKK